MVTNVFKSSENQGLCLKEEIDHVGTVDKVTSGTRGELLKWGSNYLVLCEGK